MIAMRVWRLLAAILIVGLAASTVVTQQRVPTRNGVPIAPMGLAVPPLPNVPLTYRTAEGQVIRVVVVARGLENPWSLAFLPNDTLLVTERSGRLRVVKNGILDPQPVDGVPELRAVVPCGLHDVVLHPRFAQNRLLYLTYNKPRAANQAALAVARGRWDGRALTQVQDVFVTDDVNCVSRMAFGQNGMLFVSTTYGSRLDVSQDPQSLSGKVLRLRDDGSVPADNPFVGKSGFKPEIYTLGHRSPHGLAIHPATGQVWEAEMGPNGGDEINVLQPGGNYGWPLYSLGRTYPGPWQSKSFQREGIIDPIVYWMPSISTSGLAFYTGNRLAKWKGNVFVGGLRYGEIPGTGQLQRIVLNENFEEVRREPLLLDLRQRVRDVRQGSDELIYVLTDHPSDGAVLRIEPAD